MSLKTEPDEDEQWTIDRAADLLEHYAAFIRGGHSNELVFHPYLPEIDYVAAQLRAWFKPESSSLILEREEAGGETAEPHSGNLGSSGDRPESLAEVASGDAP